MIENIGKLLDKISLGSSSKSNKSNLNEAILSETEKQFIESIKKSAVKNKMMLFHNVVKIWLYPDDYYKNEMAFLVLKPLIIDGFYNVISENLKYYDNKHMPIKNWTVKFLLCEEKTENMPKEKSFGKGNVFVTTNYEEIIREQVKENDARSTTDIGGTLVNLQNKKGKPINLSTTFLQNFKEIDDDIIPFDKGKIIKEDTPTNKLDKLKQFIQGENNNYYAKLTYDLNKGQGVQSFYMKTTKMEISGSNDKRDKKLVQERCKLDIELLPIPYAIIKYDIPKRQFQIGTYGEMNINQSPITNKMQGHSLLLYELKNNSTIQLLLPSGIVNIKFEAIRI